MVDTCLSPLRRMNRYGGWVGQPDTESAGGEPVMDKGENPYLKSLHAVKTMYVLETWQSLTLAQTNIASIFFVLNRAICFRTAEFTST